MNFPHENQKPLKLPIVYLMCVMGGIAFLSWSSTVRAQSLSLEEDRRSVQLNSLLLFMGVCLIGFSGIAPTVH